MTLTDDEQRLYGDFKAAVSALNDARAAYEAAQAQVRAAVDALARQAAEQVVP